MNTSARTLKCGTSSKRPRIASTRFFRFLPEHAATCSRRRQPFYPELHAEHREKEKEFVIGLSQVLAKAQGEGHVMPNIDTDIAAFLFLSTMRNLNENERLADYGFSRVQVFEGAFLNFLRGIATIEGISYIDEFVNNQQKQ